MTRRIPIFILLLQGWHLMEERFSTAMSADVPEEVIDRILGNDRKKKNGK